MTARLLVLALFFAGLVAMATPVDFSIAPAGWTTDRYQPNQFENIGLFNGRDNVLAIGISVNQGFGSRPGFDATFYNTQGMQANFFGGLGSSMDADLWLPATWASETNGSRRTDMWAVMTDGTSVTGYAIIGFTNFGGAPRLRVWDADTVNGWVNLATPIVYDTWASLSVQYTGTSYEYRVGGNLVYTDNTINGTTGFGAVIMQAYNFNGTDPNLTGAFAGDPLGNYTANWSSVPEPMTFVLMGLGLAGLGLCRRRS